MSIIAATADVKTAVESVVELCEKVGVDPASIDARAHVDPGATLNAPEATGRPPLGSPVDERYVCERGTSGAVIRARTAEGAFRGLVRELILEGNRGGDPDGTEQDRGAHRGAGHDRVGHDGPGLAWRGLSVDTVRYPLDIAMLRRLVDLLALHGMNVLHLHLTDNEGWRAPVAVDDAPGAAPFTAEELTTLVAYARRRFVTVVPEIDMPGHIATLAKARPELTDRRFPHPALAYLDPDNRDARAFVETAIGEIAAIFPSPYLHIGGDEVFGMSPGAYDRFVQVATEAVHTLGRKAVAWQESVRSTASVDLYQWWMTAADIPDEASLLDRAPEGMEELARAAAASFAKVADDPGRLAERHAEVIVSVQDPLYLDRRYAEPSRRPAQTEALETLGFAAYSPTATRDMLDWDPARSAPPGTSIAGVEAAIWGETIRSDDDLALLLLPRLAIAAEAAWHGRAAGANTTRRVAPAARHWAALGFTNWYRSADIVPAAHHERPRHD